MSKPIISLRKSFDEIMMTGETFLVRHAIAKVPGSRFHKKNSTWYIPYSAIAWRIFQDGLDEIYDEGEITGVKFHEVDQSMGSIGSTMTAKWSHIQQAEMWKNDKLDPGDSFLTKTRPWQHQRRAYEFLRELDFNAYLGMKMGTGKTLVAINAVADLKPQRVLILCPKSVIPVWEDEFKTHLSKNFPLSVCTLDKGSSAKRAEKLGLYELRARLSNNILACVVNYESFWRPELLAELESMKFDMLICDEAHNIKNHEGVSSKHAYKLSKKINFKILMSGTPIPNAPHDVLGQYRIIDPGIFGNWITKFRAEYYDMGGHENMQILGLKNQNKFNTLMSLVTFVVDKTVLGLPDYVHQSRVVDIGKQSWKHYINMEEEFATQVINGEVKASNAVSKLVRLQQITSGFLPFRKFTDGEVYFEEINEAKREALVETLQDLKGEKAVIFARFHHDLNVIRSVCDQLGLSSRELSGRTDKLPGGKFPKGKDVLIAQIRSGKEGLNLTESCYSIYWNVWYSLSDYDQSLSRVHRGGQTRKVTYIHLLAKDTIDEVIYQALKNKQDIISAIMEYVKTGGKVN